MTILPIIWPARISPDLRTIVAVFSIAMIGLAPRCPARETTSGPESVSRSDSELVSTQSIQTSPSPSHYDFSNADDRFKLPKTLREVSGLTVVNDTTVLAIQDEDGIIYEVGLGSGEIRSQSKFAKDGDYEGIEQVDSLIVVLRSDGTVFATTYPPSQRATRLIDTQLSQSYDTEGIGFDADGRRLLIACKEYAGKGRRDFRAVYSLSVPQLKLSDNPEFYISLVAVREKGERFRKKSLGYTGKRSFKPAGLAVHPIDGHIYVVSSVWRIIVVVNDKGDIVAVHGLSDTNMKQPEGVAFLPNGDLLLASEGAGGRSSLFRYRYQQ